MSQSQYYFSGGPYLQVLQGALAALMHTGGVVRLTGRTGVGKTALCVKLAQFLRRKNRQVLLFDNAVESPDMLRTMLARELDLPDSANLVSLLEDAFVSGERVPLVMLFDDAHLLSEVTLLEIFRLSEAQANGQALVTVLLCGEQGLEQRLHELHELRNTETRVIGSYLLEPMSAESLEEFFTGLAERMGAPETRLTSDALHQLYRNCKGYPGPALNMSRQILMDRADHQEGTLISRDDVNRFIRAAGNNEVLPSQQFADAIVQRRGFLPVAAVIVVASLAFLYQQLSGLTTPQAIATEQVADSPFALETQAQLPREPTEPVVASDIDANPVAAPESSNDNGVASPVTTAAVASEPDASPALNASAQELALVMEMARQAALQQVSNQEAVSDSGLALVTAAERGISADQFALPDYEELLAGSDELQQNEIAATGIEQGEIEQRETEQREAEQPGEPEVDPQPAIAVRSTAPEQATASDNVETAVEPTEPSTEAPVASTDSGADATPEVAVSEELAAQDAIDAPLGGPASPTAPIPGQGSPRSAVNAWVAAWQSQTLQAYFDAYHPDFEPRYQSSVTAWHRNRERVIGNADWIKLELTDFETVSTSSERVEVQFWLAYESASYRDETLKKLVLVPVQGRWLIIEEVNLEVRV